jgi:integrase
MPVYSGKEKGKWLVRIYVRGRPRTWVVDGTKADAATFEAAKRVESAQEDPRATRVVPKFSAFVVERYLPHAELHLKATWLDKQTYILATLSDHLGELKLSAIDEEAVQRYARARLKPHEAGGKQRRGLKPSSVNNELRVLRRVLNFARKECRMLIPPPAFKLLREGGVSSIKAWTDDELARLFRAAEAGDANADAPILASGDPGLLPILVFLANTGARKGEALALTWEHVDLKRRQIMIWPSEEWQPKNGKPREVPISDALLPWLSGKQLSERWVFPSGHAIKGELQRFAYWPQRRFDLVRKAAGLKGGPHTLRHTFATHFLAAVPDLYLLAQILGHSEIAVTKRYAHLLPDHLARARNAVNVSPTVGPATIEAARRWGRK